MNVLRFISIVGSGVTALTMASTFASACDALPHGVEFCSENTEFRLIQESPDKRGLIYGLPADSEHEVLGMVFVYDGPRNILSQEELFLSLNDVIGDSATVHFKDQVRGTDLSFDRIVWENSTNAGPEIAARSLFWDGEFFILAFTTEPGIQVTKAHLALHQLFVDNLRLSEGETQ